jgi:hypothetical protein
MDRQSFILGGLLIVAQGELFGFGGDGAAREHERIVYAGIPPLPKQNKEHPRKY